MYHPIRNHSHYSLLQSISRCDQIVETCKEYGYEYAGITDILSISGCIKFIKKCKENDIKPIIGTEVVFDDDSRITLICKNKQAWKDLLKVISVSNTEDNYTTHPVISKDGLFEIIDCDNFICVDGYVGSSLFQEVFDFTTYNDIADRNECDIEVDDAKKLIVKNHIELFSGLFADYYLEIDLMSSDEYGIASVMADLILDSGYDKIIPSSETYYPKRSDNIDHKVLLCVKLRTTLNKLIHKISDSKNFEFLKFIKNSNYHIKKPDHISEKYQQFFLDNMDDLVGKCEEFNLLSSPKLPHFKTPAGQSEVDYLVEICRSNWSRLIPASNDQQIYEDRLQKELKVIEEANLAGYFLIVQDYVNHFANKGVLVGPGRGSGGGSLVCYLTGITLVDPVEYDLIFERFYNAGRNTKDNVSLPDIDVDFPPDDREDIIDYIRDAYGHANVCQMITFGKMAGRSVLKEVMRANESCTFDQMNEITKKIQSEASISDLLEEMDNPSVIMWCLENDPESLADYCWIDKKGKIKGDYAKVFEQSIRMEGIYKTQGKHAAGVVISCDPIVDICPMIRQKSSTEPIASMQMEDLEACGGVKVDILGLNLLKVITDIDNDAYKREEE
jgi:DNA polymerase III subunit alpha